MAYNQIPSVGQKTMAASLPVVLASDQSAIPVSGTITSNIGTTGGLALDATLTGGNQQSKITDGTTIMSVQAIGTGQNAATVSGGYKEVTFTTTTAANLATTDVSQYKWVSVHIINQGTSSTVTFQGSNDNTNFVNVALQQPGQTVATPTFSTTSAGIYAGPLNFRYFRLNVAGISAGTTNGTIEFYTVPSSILSIGGQVALNGTTTVSGTVGLSAGSNTIGAVKITDGSNVPNVKAASTAAVATDPALVVAISPNNSVAVTGTVTANAGTGTFNIQSNASVNVSQINGSTVSTAATGVQKVGVVGNAGGAVDAAQNAAAPANVLVHGGVYNSTLPTITTGNATAIQTDAKGQTLVDVNYVAGAAINTGHGTAAGSIRVELPTDGTGVVGLTAGTNIVGKVGIDQTTKGTTNGVTLVPNTSGGFTTYHLVSAATTNATNIKASAGQLFGWYIYNSNAAARKVAFHNSALTPSAGSSVFFSIIIPPTSAANVFNETGVAFSSGIGITTTTGLADTDATAVAANDLIINLFYV